MSQISWVAQRSSQLADRPYVQKPNHTIASSLPESKNIFFNQLYCI